MRQSGIKGIRPAAIAFALLVAVASVEQAGACQICYPFPQQTAADILLESQTVVRARENPDRPFFFVPVEVLKGDLEPGDIDMFMGSTARRLLKADPDSAAVLARKGPEEPWRGLGIPGEDYERIIREILEEGTRWQRAGGSRERVEYFAALLGHKDRKIHQMAYLEVARAPYDWIRELDVSWRLEEIRSLLGNVMYIEWKPLAILLLARYGTDQDRKYLVERFFSASKFSTTLNLAAYATVFLEEKQEEAIAFIEDRYFAQSSRDREQLEEILKAVDTIGAVTGAHLRGRFVESFAVLLETHPEMAGRIAPMLAAWRRWELTGILQDIARERPGDLRIRLYLSQAPATGSE